MNSLIWLVYALEVPLEAQWRLNSLWCLLIRDCADYDGWYRQRLLWNNYWARFCHIRWRLSMTLWLILQQTAVVPCFLAVRNRGWRRHIWDVRMLPADLAGLESTCEYWAYELAFPFRNTVKPARLFYSKCCSYLIQAWMLPQIQC